MTRTRRAALLLAAIPLFAACSSGSDGGSQGADSAAAEGDANGSDATADGEVVTRNPSQSGDAGELAPQDGGEEFAEDGELAGETGGDAPSGDSATGGDVAGGDAATGGDAAGGASPGGDTTTGGDATGGAASDGDATGGADGGAGDDVLDDDPLADIPLDQIESIEDETGLIIVDVPIVWVDVATAPDGDVRRLSASTDLAAFSSGFATEGIALAARDVESGTADWTSVLDALSAEATAAGCTLLNEEVYDDAVYRGLERSYDCPGADLVVSLFGGTNEDDSTEWTMKLITQPGDEASRALAFQSFLLD